MVAETVSLLSFDSQSVGGGLLDKPKPHTSIHPSVARM